MAKTLAAYLLSALWCAGANPVLRFDLSGGSDRELAPSTVVAADGSIFVALATASPDLPGTTGAAQTALASGTCSGGDPEGGSFPRRCFNAYILYATGLGTVDGPVTSCGAPGNPPPQVTAMVTVHTG